MPTKKSKPQMLKDEHQNTINGQMELDDILWGNDDPADKARERRDILKTNLAFAKKYKKKKK